MIITVSHIKKGVIVAASALLISLVVSVGVQAFIANFFETAAVPPANNTFAPLHEGVASQTKEGQLTLGANIPIGPDDDIGLYMGNDEDTSGTIEPDELHHIVNVAHPIQAQDMATCGYVNQVLRGLTLNDCL